MPALDEIPSSFMPALPARMSGALPEPDCQPLPAGDGRPWMGVLLLGGSGLELFQACMRFGSPLNILVFLPKSNLETERWMRKNKIKYTTDFNFFLFQCPHLQVALTFGALPHLHHGRILIAISLLRTLGIPVVDVQHGLFQWGINFNDDAIQQGFDQASGISLPMDTCADVQLTWAGPRGIGYPRHPPLQRPSSKGRYILVATNTNWHIYSEESRWRLARILRELFVAHPDVPFIWKPHPAEHAVQNSSLALLVNEIASQPARFPCVKIIPSQGANSVPLDKLVADCHAGIITLGTALIDFESMGKPCSVYECREVTAMLGTVNHCDTFNQDGQLLSWLSRKDLKRRVPLTGQLHDYNAAALWREIDLASAGRGSCPPPREVIASILGHVALAKQVTR